jgi:chromosome segregation ATPase
MTTQKQNKKSNKKGLILVLSILLIGSVAFNIYSFVSNKAKSEKAQNEYIELSNDHEEVNALLADAEELTNKLEGDIAEQDSEIQSKLAEIKRIKAENDALIRSGLNKDEINRRLKANLALVKKLNNQLESKVDELLLANKSLEYKNTELSVDLDSVNTMNSKLSKKVAIASALQVPQPVIAFYKKRNSQNRPWKKTSLARRTDKIEVKFTIMSNEITERGEKSVALKIISPEGKTMGTLDLEGGDINIHGNGALSYAAHKEFTFTGKAQDITLDFVNADLDFPEGSYNSEILIDGKIVSSSTFSLK